MELYLVQDIIDCKDIKYENLNENDGTKPLTEDIFNEIVCSFIISIN